MTYPAYISDKMQIREGMQLTVVVKKKVILQDKQEYFILEDQSHVRHFMEASHYSKYNIQVNHSLLCSVVKVNCTGRIILEPCHPVYRIGGNYNFKVVEIKKLDPEPRVIIEDIFENRIEIPWRVDDGTTISSPQIITCTVTDVRKGIPIVDIAP